MSYFDDNFEEFDDDCYSPSRPRYPSRKSCEHCGKSGLVWEDTDDGFVLVDARSREVHRCLAKKARDDDFEAL